MQMQLKKSLHSCGRLNLIFQLAFSSSVKTFSCCNKPHSSNAGSATCARIANCIQDTQVGRAASSLQIIIVAKIVKGEKMSDVSADSLCFMLFTFEFDML